MNPCPLRIWLDRLDKASEATQFGSLGHDCSRGTRFSYDRSCFEGNTRNSSAVCRALRKVCSFRGLRHPSTTHIHNWRGTYADRNDTRPNLQGVNGPSSLPPPCWRRGPCLREFWSSMTSVT